MALCQTVVKHCVILITKPDSQVGINKMEGGTIRGTLQYNFSLMYMCTMLLKLHALRWYKSGRHHFPVMYVTITSLDLTTNYQLQ